MKLKFLNYNKMPNKNKLMRIKIVNSLNYKSKDYNSMINF